MAASSRVRRRAQMDRLIRTLTLAIGLLLGIWLFINSLGLRAAGDRPVEAFLVLGGSIQREIHVAELAKQYPKTPILISAGSPAPCIWRIFDRAQAPIQQVWLENCAQSTFGNFAFSIPILQRWGVRHVKLVTSPTHLPRAIWLAQILLGAHGIWVDPEIVTELGIPANQEFGLKTSLDVARSLAWAVISQLYQPSCTKQQALGSINPTVWQHQTVPCEHQGNVD